MRLVLGSASPRRREILSFFSIPFVQVASPFDERQIPFTGNPQEYARHLSERKAHHVSEQFPDEIILTADTIVFFKEKLFNKPASRDEAFQFLSELAGQWHQVFTAITLQKGDAIHSAVEETRILFHPLTTQQINRYISSVKTEDKAGGYAVQGAGGVIVSRIEGCYYNAMGLPINTLRTLLLSLGVDLWNHLKAS